MRKAEFTAVVGTNFSPPALLPSLRGEGSETRVMAMLFVNL